MVVELCALAKAPELNGRRGVITACLEGGGRWEVLCFPPADGAGAAAEAEPRRVSVGADRLSPVPGAHPPGSIRMRLRNVPSSYDTALLREELEDEGFAESESFTGLLFDAARGFGYLTASSERSAMQIIGNFDGRRLERSGPGRLMPDSVLAQIVKVERL